MRKLIKQHLHELWGKKEKPYVAKFIPVDGEITRKLFLCNGNKPLFEIPSKYEEGTRFSQKQADKLFKLHLYYEKNMMKESMSIGVDGDLEMDGKDKFLSFRIAEENILEFFPKNTKYVYSQTYDRIYMVLGQINDSPNGATIMVDTNGQMYDFKRLLAQNTYAVIHYPKDFNYRTYSKNKEG